MTGHVLGHSSKRAKGLVPERNLSPVVLGVTRVLMHCAMIEGACRQPQVIKSRFLCLECQGSVEKASILEKQLEAVSWNALKL